VSSTMQRRTPLAQRTTPPGVTLVPSTMGGYSVELDGVYAGWINAAADGSRFNAYLRLQDQPPGEFLGVHSHDAAVETIVAAHRERGAVSRERQAA